MLCGVLNQYAVARLLLLLVIVSTSPVPPLPETLGTPAAAAEPLATGVQPVIDEPPKPVICAVPLPAMKNHADVTAEAATGTRNFAVLNERRGLVDMRWT